jgi:hypothetical protein
MLGRMEKSPSAVFYERELAQHFPEAFERAKREKLLSRVVMKADVGSYSHGLSRPYTLIRDGDRFEAFDDEDPEADIIELTPDDLAQWRLDLGVLAQRFQGANGLSGKEGALDSRLYFLGDTRRDGLSVAFVLCLLCERKSALIHLKALPNSLSHRYDRFVVVSPSFSLTPTEQRELESLDVFVAPLAVDDPLLLDCTQALQKPSRRAPRVSLSDEEEREFALRGFRSRLPILITGRTEGRRRNLLEVAGHDVILTDSSFRLLLRLVVALVETDDGFLSRADLTYGADLDSEQALAPEGLEQALSRLRGPFRPALGDLKPTQLIEVRGGRVRLSTHHRYVAWDLDALMLHADGVILGLSRRLAQHEPANGRSQGPA